jgi:AraC-like DNA-binding protein
MQKTDKFGLFRYYSYNTHMRATPQADVAPTLPARESRFIRLPPAIISTFMKDKLLSPLLPCSVGYREGQDIAIGFRVRRSGGEFLVKYCVSGHGFFRFSGAEYEVCPGDLVVLPAAESHEYGAVPADPWAVYWVYFIGQEASRWAKELLGFQSEPVIARGNDPELTGYFERIYAAYARGYARTNILHGASLLRCALSHCLSGGAESASAPGSVTDQAMRWMRLNIEKNISLTELSARFGYSPDHFSRLFKSAFGYSPMDYFLRLKLQRAGELLATTVLSAREIAEELGFSDPAYFSRVFKEKNGVSAREFRRNRP